MGANEVDSPDSGEGKVGGLKIGFSGFRFGKKFDCFMKKR